MCRGIDAAALPRSTADRNACRAGCSEHRPALQHPAT